MDRPLGCKIDFKPRLFLFYIFDLLDRGDSWWLWLANILNTLSCLGQKTKFKYEYTIESYSSSTKDSSIETLASMILLSFGDITALASLKEL